MQSVKKELNKDKSKSSLNGKKEIVYVPEQKRTIPSVPKHELYPLKIRCARKTSRIETPYFSEHIELELATLKKIKKTLEEVERLLKENLTKDVLKKVKILLSVIRKDIRTMKRCIPKDERKMTFFIFELKDSTQKYIHRYRNCLGLYNISLI